MPNKIIAMSLIVLFLGGCTSWGSSPFWPSLNDDATISSTPAAGSIAAKELECLKGGTEAENCANNTINELSAMLESTGHFKRGAGYALVAAGGAAGGAIAFDASRDLLMGLAIGVASILGLDAVVNSDGQYAVLRAGLRATRCVYGTALAAKKLGSEAKQGFESLTQPPSQFLPNATRSNLNTLLGFTDAQFSSIGALIGEAGEIPAKQELGPAVVEIRALVREGLFETIPALDGLAQAQRNRSDAMIDAFRRKVEAAKDQAQLQVNAGFATSTLNREQFFDALAATQAVEEKIESPLERLRNIAQAACKA